MASPKKQLLADNNKKANSRSFSNMANRYDNNVKVAFAWYMYIRKRRQLFRTRCKSNFPPGISSRKLNKRVALIQAILAYLHQPRERLLWMHPRSLIWFDMVDEQYNDELWYANFRVTKRTFEFILDKVQQEICRKSTPMRDPVTAKRRLAITLYYLSSTAEYRTVANLFGVSRSFVCQCIKEVSCAIIKCFPRAIAFLGLSLFLRETTFLMFCKVTKKGGDFPCVLVQ